MGDRALPAVPRGVHNVRQIAVQTLGGRVPRMEDEMYRSVSDAFGRDIAEYESLDEFLEMIEHCFGRDAIPRLVEQPDGAWALAATGEVILVVVEQQEQEEGT